MSKITQVLHVHAKYCARVNTYGNIKLYLLDGSIHVVIINMVGHNHELMKPLLLFRSLQSWIKLINLVIKSGRETRKHGKKRQQELKCPTSKMNEMISE